MGERGALRKAAGLVRGEVRKAAHDRWTWVAVALGMVGAGTAAGILASRFLAGGPIAAAVARSSVASSLAGQVRAAMVAELAAALFGVGVGTSEWRARTWTTTAALEPRRLRTAVAKLVTVAVGGALVTLVGLVVAAGVASAWVPSAAAVFARQHVGGAPTIAQLWRAAASAAGPLAAAGAALACVWALVAFLVRIATLTTALAVAELVGGSRLLAESAPHLARFLPEWAVQGVAAPPSSSFPLSFADVAVSGNHSVAALSVSVAACDLVVVVGVLAVASAAVLRRADFT